MIMYFVFGYSDKIFLFMDTTNFSKLFSTFAACSRNQLTKQLQKIELQRKKMNNRKETNKKKKSRHLREKKRGTKAVATAQSKGIGYLVLD